MFSFLFGFTIDQSDPGKAEFPFPSSKFCFPCRVYDRFVTVFPSLHQLLNSFRSMNSCSDLRIDFSTVLSLLLLPPFSSSSFLASSSVQHPFISISTHTSRPPRPPPQQTAPHFGNRTPPPPLSLFELHSPLVLLREKRLILMFAM